ncbi:TM0106 family RecB-like putative nuclease [Candidatus Uhrbacteria bacterium]|nr:MAG: TM0106 family RecB-like putative nuclease [Candidatus Uhrbacteria bacterium]
MDRLKATDFYRFLQCPHWPYWERFGDKKDRRPLTADEEKRLNDGLIHEREIVADKFGEAETVERVDDQTDVARTLELMRQGAGVIYQGVLEDGDWFGRPDLLEKQEGKSAFGDWYYVPIDVKRSHELKKEHKAQLMFYAVLLERIQGAFPSHPAILNADGERISFDAASFEADFRELLQELERIREGVRPEPVYRKSCEDTSPWGAACLRLAEETRDIALLYNVDVRKLRALRSLGVTTIDRAAELDVDALEGQAPGLTRRSLEAVRRQAISLTQGSVIIREPFVDPTEGLEIHFDIESHPPTDVDYLYGIWIPSGPDAGYLSFVAERPEDEERMWRDFLAWLATLPESYTVWHYARYEAGRLDVLARRYKSEANPDLIRFKNALRDLKEMAADTAVFPLYFYSLKTIGKFLGFAWEGEVKGGGESVTAYETWLSSKNRATLDAIIQYNREDVRATAHLLDWLRRYAREQKTYEKPYPWKT